MSNHCDQDTPNIAVDPPRPIRLPSRERGCEGKANLGGKYAKQADRLSAKHGKQYGVYRCPHCNGTHLTTKLFKADQYSDLLHITEPNTEIVDA